MVVLLSTGASCYRKCCIGGGTSTENFGSNHVYCGRFCIVLCLCIVVNLLMFCADELNKNGVQYTKDESFQLASCMSTEKQFEKSV